MKSLILLFSAVLISGCSRPASKPNPSQPTLPLAIAPRYSFLIEPHGSLAAVYRCNNYTGEIVTFYASDGQFHIKPVAAANSREDVALLHDEATETAPKPAQNPPITPQ